MSRTQPRWLNKERTIVLHDYGLSISYDKVEQMVLANQAMLASVPHLVDLVIDISGATVQGSFIRYAQHAEQHVPPNQHRVFMVGAPWLVRANVKMARRTAPRSTGNVIFVDSVPEALALIQQAPTQVTRKHQP